MVTATDMLVQYLAAESAVLEGQTYTFGDRTLTKADLADIRKGRKEWEQRVAAESGAAIGAPTIGGLGYSLARLN